MKFLILLFIISISLTLNAQIKRVHSQPSAKTAAGTTHKANCSYSVFPTENNSWGYDIYIGKRLVIHQPIVPGMQGNNGFPDKTAAGKAARLAIKNCTKSVTVNPSKSSSATETGNTWVQKANVGGLSRYGASGFSIGGKGYIGLGNQATSSGLPNDFWEYDTTSNAWTQKANFGGPARVNAVGFAIGNKGYMGTGSDDTSYYDDFWEYDPVANTWTQKADFAAGLRRDASGFSIGTKGYIGTGDPYGAASTNDFWEYDPSTNTWTQKANFGGIGRINATAFSIGGKGYLGTGYANNGDLKNDFWEYDPSTDTWTQKANFGGIARAGAVSFGLGTRGYMGTGFNFSSGYLNDFWEYDPYSDSWTQKADFGGGNRGSAVGFNIRDVGYIGTGNNYSFENDFWAFEPGCIPPSPPTNTTAASNQTICANHSTTLSASGQGTLDWFDAASGGNWLGTGPNFLTPVLLTNTTYYVQDSTCEASARTSIAVTVNPLPAQAGPISGTAKVCAGRENVAYSISPVANASNYSWILPPNATISSGGGTSITLNFAANAVSGNLAVYGTNSCGNGMASPNFSITVNPVPPAPMISNSGDTLFSNAPYGNQWYFEGTLLAGDSLQTLVAGKSGQYWDIITLNTCSSDTSNHILLLKTGIYPSLPADINVFPLPNDGKFWISMTNPSKGTYAVSIYNTLGKKIYQDNVAINRSLPTFINLGPIPAGVYFLTLENGHHKESRKIIVN
ncbi:MAG: DUF4907 domain-containing protein [Bacteroidetes bacterium]|nr:DUF4907 domain-containing protein [Bacteroidota bacterium]